MSELSTVVGAESSARGKLGRGQPVEVEDRVHTPEISQRTADGVRDGRLVRCPGTGHGGTITRRRFADDVTRFLLTL
ncbi:alpha/beta fold hydrolase [Geodermatophilus sp. SYSU D00705]